MIKKISLKNKSKTEKIEIILDYALQIYEKEERFVSKREIRSVFNVELYNYFKNLFDLYRQLNIEIPLCYCPKDYAKKKIIEFVRIKSEEKLFPIRTEIEKELNIHIRTYFKNIKELYEEANIDFELYGKRKYKLEHPCNSEEINNENKEKIISYIQGKTSKGFYPSVNIMQEKFNLSFYKYFKDIKDAYKEAKINYHRPCPIILGREKEIMFTNIIIKLFKKMNFKIQRISIYDKKLKNKNEDLKIIDKNGEKILVELKAYRKNYNISKRELNQLNNYMKKQNIRKGFFISTSNKINYSINNIENINGNKLIKLLKKYNMNYHINNINWIQTEKVNSFYREKIKKERKEKIIIYMKSCKQTLMKNKLEKELNISLRTYFPNKKFKEIIQEIKKN